MKQLIKKLKSLFKSNKEEVVETTHKPKEIKVGKTKRNYYLNYLSQNP